MKAVSSGRQVLHATLCEIERGVFYVTYPDMDLAAATGELAIYQVGASAADAKQQVEQHAHALGYETVVWNDANVAPLFPIGHLQDLGEPTTAHAQSRRA